MMPEAVVIGAGPNGLVAANLLVDRGWDVLVLEAAPTPGGAVRSEELIEPGFINDVFSAFYPLGFASPVLHGLHLERYGLVWRRAPIVLAHPAPDGSCPIISTDLDETAASLDAFHRGDGDAWRELYGRWQQVSGGLLDALFTPIPPVRATGRLAVSTLRDGPLRFARFAILPARRLATEYFQSEEARRLFAACSLHADLSPDDILGGFFGWILAGLAQDVGWPVPQGGAGFLTQALVSRFRAMGGRIECNAPVDGVIVRNKRAVAVRARGEEIAATRAVLADVDAPRLYLQLVGAEHLPGRLVDNLHGFTWDHGVCKVDWNLDAPIPWRAEAARRAGTVHVIESVDALGDTRAQIAAGAVPAQPFLIVGQQSMTDATRMPSGRETAWAYTHVPRDVVNDRDASERLADRMQARVEELAPGFSSLIRGRHVMGPRDLEARNPNLVGGAIGGGTGQLYQQLVFRPTPGFGRAETPVRGLYLASASAHPGGGVHGACGANAARAAVFHDRLRAPFRSR
jgi:phytoene dehydrogenase-like protein